MTLFHDKSEKECGAPPGLTSLLEGVVSNIKLLNLPAHTETWLCFHLAELPGPSAWPVT